VGVTQSPKHISTTSCPKFVPRRFLRGGHVQTIASFLMWRRIQLPAPEERLIEVAPGVRLLCHCHWQVDRTKALTIIVVHGLEGSSESQYARGIAEKGLAAGMNVIRYNQRNCGGTEALAPVLYHSGLSSDIAAVAREVIVRDGVSHLALVGFSDALHRPSNRLYEAYFLWALRRRMLEKVRLFPGIFDPNRLRGIRSLREFDDRVTAYYCGFAGAVDYYDRASATHVIGQITVPTLVLHAANDPFILITQETRGKFLANPHVKLVETDDGGHCAFIGERNGSRNEAGGQDDGYWAENEIVKFLSRF
jgi:uncharacterized protein